MKHKLNKWDIVKVIKPPESIRSTVSQKTTRGGWYITDPDYVQDGFDFIGNKIFVPKSAVGKQFYIAGIIGSTNFKINLYRAFRLKGLENTYQIPSTLLPEDMLIPSGERVLDVRTLSKGDKDAAFTKVSSSNSRFDNILYRTTSYGIINSFSYNTLRKFEQVFFPPKKYSLKSVMFEIMKAKNLGVSESFKCQHCGWYVNIESVASKRYFRKNDGGTTHKCIKCGKNNFIVLDFTQHPGGVFVLSKTNGHIE